MSPRLVSDAQLMDRLTELFRRSGFESASMADIAAATGLQKSSLYHRFPDGKAQMASEVIAAVGQQFADSILAPLADDAAPLAQRVRAVADNLDAFYRGGASNCLLDVLSVGHPGGLASAALASTAESWISAFTKAAREAGADDDTALARGQGAVAAIEGALVLARVTGDRRPFARAIRGLDELLLGGTRR